MKTIIALLCAICFESVILCQNDPNELLIKEVTFTNQGDTLSGTIVLPPGIGLFPAVVEIHGSGPEKRHLWLAEQFAKQGIAFLTYDKRGCGKSQGNYIGDEPGEINVSPENITLLAKDAYAAFKVLKASKNIDTTRIGIFGGSQIGWIAPITASYDKSISFMALMSAPVVAVDQELYFSNIAENNPDFFKEYSPLQIDSLMANAPKTGVNPIPYLKSLHIPILWLYGEFDNSIPVSESIKNLKLIEKETNQDYDIEILENRNHQLTLVGENKENDFEFIINKIIEWIKLR